MPLKTPEVFYTPFGAVPGCEETPVQPTSVDEDFLDRNDPWAVAAEMRSADPQRCLEALSRVMGPGGAAVLLELIHRAEVDAD